MRKLRLLIGVIVILVIVCSPVLAISKSSLMAFYKGQVCEGQCMPDTYGVMSISYTTIPPTPTPTPYVPSWVGPTSNPTSENSLCPSWVLSPAWMIPWKSDSSSIKPTITPTPTNTPSSSTGCAYASCPPAVPVGYLHHTFCMCMAYKNAVTGEVGGEECINPETGRSYPIGMDALGNCYLVKPGCQAQWAD